MPSQQQPGGLLLRRRGGGGAERSMRLRPLLPARPPPPRPGFSVCAGCARSAGPSGCDVPPALLRPPASLESRSPPGEPTHPQAPSSGSPRASSPAWTGILYRGHSPPRPPPLSLSPYLAPRWLPRPAAATAAPAAAPTGATASGGQPRGPTSVSRVPGQRASPDPAFQRRDEGCLSCLGSRELSQHQASPHPSPPGPLRKGAQSPKLFSVSGGCLPSPQKPARTGPASNTFGCLFEIVFIFGVNQHLLPERLNQRIDALINK